MVLTAVERMRRACPPRPTGCTGVRRACRSEARWTLHRGARATAHGRWPGRRPPGFRRGPHQTAGAQPSSGRRGRCRCRPTSLIRHTDAARRPCPSCSRCVKKRAQRRHVLLFLAAESHRAERVGFGEVVHGIALVARNIEQPGIGAECRRSPVGRAGVLRRDERATDVEVLRGITHGPATLVQAFGPIRSRRRTSPWSRCSPVRRSSDEEVSVPVACITNLRGRPSNSPSIRAGV